MLENMENVVFGSKGNLSSLCEAYSSVIAELNDISEEHFVGECRDGFVDGSAESQGFL
jgi:hypothetical protein